ncbi:conserved hypothetical protein [uncultured Thiomicrorhabdus sp.]
MKSSNEWNHRMESNGIEWNRMESSSSNGMESSSSNGIIIEWTQSSSNGIEWTRMESNGLKRTDSNEITNERNGIKWNRMESTMDSNGIEWNQMDSNGRRLKRMNGIIRIINERNRMDTIEWNHQIESNGIE